jgi:hypothetical protein
MWGPWSSRRSSTRCRIACSVGERDLVSICGEASDDRRWFETDRGELAILEGYNGRQLVWQWSIGVTWSLTYHGRYRRIGASGWYPRMGFPVNGRGCNWGRPVTHTFSFCFELVGTFTDMMKYVFKDQWWGNEIGEEVIMYELRTELETV